MDTASDRSSLQYAKTAVALGSAAVFGGILLRMRMRSKGQMELPMARLMMESASARAADPKLAAYMFAGRAFFTGTALTLSASLAMTMGVAAALDLKEFSQKMKSLSKGSVLNGKYSENHDDEVDDAEYEFLLAFRDEAEREQR
ncbi:hypothetical protein CcCBS67573_g10346 [Chytriomyces confervae]|uniref:Uncharacterized protein n=1 Tax=Chytriomyces confervae TaxID=246404 RepID=A0A507D3A8_9FUNG|nr:hypothetical protein CcCBS67573_g10346 [Chytriomyces confervae]